MIEIKDVTFNYDENKVFDGLNLTIGKGEFVAVLGPNGSGKSTLSRLLVGLLQPSTGEIVIDDQKLDAHTITDIRKKISIVFQNPDNQFVGQTVVDDVAFGLENCEMPREEMKARIESYLEKVRLSGLEDEAPHELSGGQKQRAAIAGALVTDAEVLILDEATSMLDPRGRKEVIDLVREISQEENRTIIMITHHLDEAAYADRIVVLMRGKVIKDGMPNEVLTDTKMLLTADLDATFATHVSKKLKDEGILNDIYVNNEELVKALCTLTLKT